LLEQNYLIKLLLQKSFIMYDQLVETFQINNRINLYLLEAIDEKHLADVYSGSKGRSAGKQWAHLHNVRLMWLKASAPELMEGILKIEDTDALNKKVLKNGLTKSGKAIESLFRKAEKEGRIKGFKPHPAAFLGYLLAHEAHHRGQIIISLKQNGHMIDQKTQYGIWEWGVR
jgi:uncharacterized damage-inducible protein DinB